MFLSSRGYFSRTTKKNGGAIMNCKRHEPYDLVSYDILHNGLMAIYHSYALSRQGASMLLTYDDTNLPLDNVNSHIRKQFPQEFGAYFALHPYFLQTDWFENGERVFVQQDDARGFCNVLLQEELFDEFEKSKSFRHTNKFHENIMKYHGADMSYLKHFFKQYKFSSLNDEWMYGRIMNSGDGALEHHTRHRMIHKTKWRTDHYKKIFTFVRDPIEHFLSGMTHCM